MPWPLPLAADLPAEAAPDADGDSDAEGRAAYAAGKPVTDNPYPFRDPRRPRWDGAWRAASGSDGMGAGGEVVPFGGPRK